MSTRTSLLGSPLNGAVTSNGQPADKDIITYSWSSCTWTLSCVRVWNVDFFLKKHVKFERMRSAFFKVPPHRLLYIFPIFWKFMNTTPFCCEPFTELFFHVFVQTKALFSKYVKSSMQTSGNLKEPSLASKQHGIELSSWVLPMCREWQRILRINTCCKNGKNVFRKSIARS